MTWFNIAETFTLLFDQLKFTLFTFCYSMSPSMVACIAVEAISILEKLHMKGYHLFSFSYKFI